MSYPSDRVLGLGTELVGIHDALREELAALRAGVRRGRDLAVHCAAFCAAVTAHHTAEDGGVFGALAQRFPELGPVLAELRRDHEQVAGLLVALADGDHHDLDGVAALLESHFGYEERTIVAALNELGPRPDLALTDDIHVHGS